MSPVSVADRRTGATAVSDVRDLADTFRMSAIEAGEVSGKGAADAYEWCAEAVEVTLRNDPVVLAESFLYRPHKGGEACDWWNRAESRQCNYYKSDDVDLPHDELCLVGLAVAAAQGGGS